VGKRVGGRGEKDVTPLSNGQTNGIRCSQGKVEKRSFGSKFSTGGEGKRLLIISARGRRRFVLPEGGREKKKGEKGAKVQADSEPRCMGKGGVFWTIAYQEMSTMRSSCLLLEEKKKGSVRSGQCSRRQESCAKRKKEILHG